MTLNAYIQSISKYKGSIERWLTSTFSIFLLSYVEINSVIKAGRVDAASGAASLSAAHSRDNEL
jgi:hypothetical protein